MCLFYIFLPKCNKAQFRMLCSDDDIKGYFIQDLDITNTSTPNATPKDFTEMSIMNII